MQRNVLHILHYKREENVANGSRALVKTAGTDTRYFAGSKFSRSLDHKKSVWLDLTISLQIRILILFKEVGYLFGV